jgi:hypothetical protein
MFIMCEQVGDNHLQHKPLPFGRQQRSFSVVRWGCKLISYVIHIQTKKTKASTIARFLKEKANEGWPKYSFATPTKGAKATNSVNIRG